MNGTGIVKSYRDAIADNSSNGTKNAQLKCVLDYIQNSQGNSLEVLKATVGYITGNEVVSKLPPRLLQAIKFITANSNNYWFTGSQKITRGTAQIIFASCYFIAKQSFKGYESISGTDFPTQASKFKFISDTLTRLSKFPNDNQLQLKHSLQNDDGSIDGFDKSYLDCANIDSNGNIRITGGGYDYSYQNGKISSDEIPNTRSSTTANSTNKISNGDSEFEMLGNLSELDLKTSESEANKEEYRKNFGKLTSSEVDQFISKACGKEYSHGGEINIENKNKVFIYPTVSGQEEMNRILSDDKLYQRPNTDNLVLIPYGITNRGLFRENHMVLVAIYQGKVTVIDPKSKSDSQITAVPCTVISPKWQGTFDRTNCARYVVYLTVQLKSMFVRGESFDDLNLTVGEIQYLSLDSLRREISQYGTNRVSEVILDRTSDPNRPSNDSGFPGGQRKSSTSSNSLTLVDGDGNASTAPSK